MNRIGTQASNISVHKSTITSILKAFLWSLGSYRPYLVPRDLKTALVYPMRLLSIVTIGRQLNSPAASVFLMSPHYSWDIVTSSKSTLAWWSKNLIGSALPNGPKYSNLILSSWTFVLKLLFYETRCSTCSLRLLFSSFREDIYWYNYSSTSCSFIARVFAEISTLSWIASSTLDCKSGCAS